MLNYVESLNKFGIVEHLPSFLKFFILRLFCYYRIFSVALFVSDIWPMDPEIQKSKIQTSFFLKNWNALKIISYGSPMEAIHLPTLIDAPGHIFQKNITSPRPQ